MLTLLKATLIVTVVGVCGCNKRKNVTSPARLQRDVLDDYDIQAQSLFGPLPSAYNQPTRNRDPYGSGLLPSRGHGQLNTYGRQYGTRPSPWGGQIQQNRNTDYRLHDESEETRGRFTGPQVLPPRNRRPISNYGGPIHPLPLTYPGQYRPQQQNSQWPQPIAPYYYSALPLKGSSIIQSTSSRLPFGSINEPHRPSSIYQLNAPYTPSDDHVISHQSSGGPGYHQTHIVPLSNGKTAVVQHSVNPGRSHQSQSVSFNDDNDLTILQAEASTQLDDISNDNIKPSTQFKSFNEAVEPVLPRAQPTQSVDVAKDDTTVSTHSQTADEIASPQSDVVIKDDGTTINDGAKAGLKLEDVESIANQPSLRKSPAPVPEGALPKTTTKADLDSTISLSGGSIVRNSSLPKSATIAVHDPAAKSVEKADNDPAPRSEFSEDASTSTQA